MSDNPHTFHMTIASVGETLFEGVVAGATLPGLAGEFTILPQHEPIVTTLKKGTITIRITKDEARQFEIDGGVVECSGNRAVVLL